MSALDPDDVELVARALVAELVEHAGDPEAVDHAMRSWLDVLDHEALGIVAMVAVRDVFATCLTRVPADELPPGALVLAPPPNGEDQ